MGSSQSLMQRGVWICYMLSEVHIVRKHVYMDACVFNIREGDSKYTDGLMQQANRIKNRALMIQWPDGLRPDGPVPATFKLTSSLLSM